MLHEDAAERMTDHDGLFRQRPDDALIVIDDLALADLRECGIGESRNSCRRAIVERPIGRDDGIALRLVACLEALPALAH